MKKIFKKSNILSFVLGAIIFSGITSVAAYTLFANDIGFNPRDNNWHVDNVKDAIDDLYDKAKPDYSGETTFTPTTSSQTIATRNKILRSNITINAIPSNYKKLSQTTTASANDISNGKTAYDSNGDLITGNNLGISSSTTAATSISFSVSSTSQSFNLGFQPNYIYCVLSNGSTNVAHIIFNKDYNSSQVSYSTTTGSNNAPRLMELSNFYTINNNGFTFNFYTSSGTWVNANVNCSAVK